MNNDFTVKVNIKPGQKYKHFKGGKYEIIAIGENTETGEKMVVYRALYGEGKIYVRPYEMFIEEIDDKKYPGSMQKHRFEMITE